MAWFNASPSTFSLHVEDVIGEVLAQRFRDFYANDAKIDGADWSLEITRIAKEVLGDDKVYRAFVYGKYVNKFEFSGNVNKGCFASLLPGQYCPAHPSDKLDDETFIGLLQNSKVFVTKLNAYGMWWWVGAPATFEVIEPQPFQLLDWKVIPHFPTDKNGNPLPLKAGQELPLTVQVHFKWGTGQRAVAFRADLMLETGSGEVVSEEHTPMFIVSRSGDLPEEATVNLDTKLKLPEILYPGDYTIRAVLYYAIP